MKLIVKSLVIFSTAVLLSSCGHGGNHTHNHSGKSCGCSAEKGACQCEQKNETANKDGQKNECQDCKKGS